MPALSYPGDVGARAGVAASLSIPYASAPWHIREEEYPERAPLRERLQFFLRYAILAPSSYNSQHQRASSLPDFGAPVWSQAVGSVGPGEQHAAHVRQRVGSPPLLAVLGTSTDAPQAWLAAG
jgi:hypothetical protein